MTRINAYDASGRGGWFDYDKAERWSDCDYNGNGSGGIGRGQAILRTAQGRWVLQHWTRWEGEADRFEFIEPDQAQEWLLRNNCDRAVEEYFGEIEEERGPGRPAIGSSLEVRLPDAVRDRVKESARESGLAEAAVARNIICAHYNNPA